MLLRGLGGQSASRTRDCEQRTMLYLQIVQEFKCPSFRRNLSYSIVLCKATKYGCTVDHQYRPQNPHSSNQGSNQILLPIPKGRECRSSNMAGPSTIDGFTRHQLSVVTKPARPLKPPRPRPYPPLPRDPRPRPRPL